MGLEWTDRIKESWEREKAQERLALQDMRGVLQDHAGPWAYGELEGKVLAGGQVGPVAVRAALWTLMNSDELAEHDDGLMYQGSEDSELSLRGV